MADTRSTDHDLAVRAAWLYYVHGKGQEEVARALHVSRFKVTRLLAAARDSGIVKITIEHEMAETLALADWIARRWNLKECILTPYFEDEVAGMSDDVADRLARRSVGIAAANHLTRRLQNAEQVTVGLGSGRTIAALAEAFTGFPKPNACFVSICGSLTHTASTHAFEVVQRFAQACGAEGHFLAAPFLTDSVEDFDVITGQRIVQETLALARTADFHIVSLGELTRDAFLVRQGLLTEPDLERALAAGAACDMAGKFFDAEGRLATCDLNLRSPSLSVADLERQEVVLLAAGRRKGAALRSILKTGLIDRLILDGELATQILG